MHPPRWSLGLVLVACTGAPPADGSDTAGAVDTIDTAAADTGTPSVAYTVGGTATGLAGAVVLQNNGGDDLSVGQDGAFAFPTPLATGAAYAVTVVSAPADQVCAVRDGEGVVGDTDVTDVVVTCQTVHRLGGVVRMVTGGRGMVLQNDGGDDLTVGGGAFTFDTPLVVGTPYDVTVLHQAICPARVCRVNRGTGIMPDHDVTDIDVACEIPDVGVATVSWATQEMALTDHLWSHADGDTATPRVVTGGLKRTGGDEIAIDRDRGLLYHANADEVQVWDDLSAIVGEVPPIRTFSVPRSFGFDAVEIDPKADRLYVAGQNEIFVIDGASTATGPIKGGPAFEVQKGGTVGSLALDRERDVLYVGSAYQGWVASYDSASTLTTGAVASRTVSWSPDRDTGFHGPGQAGVEVDPCNDRLYIGSNWPSPAGWTLFAFDGASTLDGPLDVDADSQARSSVGAIKVMLDGADRLYTLDDAHNNRVRVLRGASGLIGDVLDEPYEIFGVVSQGYAMDWFAP